MPLITTPDQRLRVFVSSTMEEMAAERAAVRKAIEALHLTPVLFEMGARPHPPQELYRAYLDQSDIFVGIYGDRYGWVAPGESVSGIEDEYNLSAGMPRLIYIRSQGTNRHPSLVAMLERMATDGLSYRHFRDAAELENLVADDLAVAMSERFASLRASRTEAPAIDHRLPAPTTRFVGRRQTLAELERLLADDDVRLITLTGPGGIGKTRIAFEIATRSKERFADGVAVVLLAPVRSQDLIPTKMATSLGLSVSASRSPTEVVAAYLRPREFLLVIDNFEHLIGAAPLLVELLEDCPNLKVIATSREMLRISPEHVYVVAPLELSSHGAEHAEAIELFLDRSLALGRSVADDDRSLADVAEICRRLDGLPLAIELAAARTRILVPSEILARLDHRLELLTHGPSDLPERQRTLRDTIEWSYDLLDDQERTLFESLGVFRGGFTLSAAEGVVSGLTDVLQSLASLVDKSLIRVEATSTEPRFTMLETLREFALDRLAARSDPDDVQGRHAAYFTDWIATVETDGREGDAVRQIAVDNDNLRAALAWLIEHGDAARAARAAAQLWKFWWLRSLFLEGISWMERIKAGSQPLDTFERATVDFTIGILAFGNGDYVRAKASLAEARTAYEELGDIRGAALTWICLGVAMTVDGNPEGEKLLLRAVETLRDEQDRWALAFALFGLGRVILMQGRSDEAVPLLEESSRRAVGLSQTLLTMGLVNLCWARLSAGDIDRAREAAQGALAEARSMESRDGIARALEALAGVALAEDDLERSAHLFGGAEAVRRSIGGVVWVPDLMTHMMVEASLQQKLGRDRFDGAYRRGMDLAVDDAVALAPEDGAPTPKDARLAERR